MESKCFFLRVEVISFHNISLKSSRNRAVLNRLGRDAKFLKVWEDAPCIVMKYFPKVTSLSYDGHINDLAFLNLSKSIERLHVHIVGIKIQPKLLAKLQSLKVTTNLIETEEGFTPEEDEESDEIDWLNFDFDVMKDDNFFEIYAIDPKRDISKLSKALEPNEIEERFVRKSLIEEGFLIGSSNTQPRIEVRRVKGQRILNFQVAILFFQTETYHFFYHHKKQFNDFRLAQVHCLPASACKKCIKYFRLSSTYQNKLSLQIGASEICYDQVYELFDSPYSFLVNSVEYPLGKISLSQILSFNPGDFFSRIEMIRLDGLTEVNSSDWLKWPEMKTLNSLALLFITPTTLENFEAICPKCPNVSTLNIDAPLTLDQIDALTKGWPLLKNIQIDLKHFDNGKLAVQRLLEIFQKNCNKLETLAIFPEAPVQDFLRHMRMLEKDFYEHIPRLLSLTYDSVDDYFDEETEEEEQWEEEPPWDPHYWAEEREDYYDDDEPEY